MKKENQDHNEKKSKLFNEKKNKLFNEKKEKKNKTNCHSIIQVISNAMGFYIFFHHV